MSSEEKPSFSYNPGMQYMLMRASLRLN